MKNITKEILKLGVTKYGISKRLGTSWNTVAFWEREVWNPSKKYRVELEKLLEELKEG